jgi:hypothetical protein
MKVWPIGTPKNPKTRIIKGDRKKFVDESVIGKKFGGVQLMRYTTVRKASSQYFSGMEAWARKVKPISTMCQCFHSETPFCWCVWGQETW